VSDPAELEAFNVKTMLPETTLSSRLSPGCSYLFHGTNPSSAISILKTGFVLRHAGATTGAMYGNGIYTAECSSKSDEYGLDDGGNTYPGLLALLVCRCFVGKPYVVNEAGNHVQDAMDGGYHSVCGDRESVVSTYREFVFFNESQIYPEYAIIYRREYDQSQVDPAMVTPTTGTTGRFWQARGDILGYRGWRNVPTEINKMLISAAKRSSEPITIPLHEVPLVWDVNAKTVTNPDGSNSPLRPPMRSSE